MSVAEEGRRTVIVTAANADRYSDTTRLEDAFRSCHADVLRYALTLTRDRDEAEDVASEAFERAIRAWRGSTPLEPLPWLLLVARRIATDRWRRVRRAATPRRISITEESDPNMETEFWLWFDSLGAVLTKRQREVLVLKYNRDLTDAQIARIIGLTESGVRSLTGRAIHALRAHPEMLL